MKQIIISAILILLLNRVLYAQITEPVYFNNLYSQKWSSCWSIVEHDSCYFGCGISNSWTTGYKNITLIKLNSEGDSLYWNEFQVNNSDHYPGVSSSFNRNNLFSGFIVGGSNSNGINQQGLIIKFTDQAEIEKFSLYPNDTNGDMFFQHSKLMNTGEVILTGERARENEYSDVLLLKTDSLSNEIWRNYYGWETADKGFKVLPTSDGGYIISGYTYLPGDNYSGDALLIKTDSLGNQLWYKTPGSEQYSDGYGSVTLAHDGNYVYGYTHAVWQEPPYPVPESYRKIKFIKYNQNGNVLWERMYGIPYQYNMLRNIITLENGNYLAVGYAQSDTINGPMQGWLMKINQYGDSTWYRDYRYYINGPTFNYLYDVYETSNKGLIACGQAYKAIPGPDAIQRMWIIKLDSNGCEEPGCDPTVGISANVADEFEGLVVYPNPAYSVLNVKYLDINESQSQKNFGKLEIWDLFGRRVEEIKIPEGQKRFHINISACPAGIYVVVLKSDGMVLGRRKFIVSK